MEKSTFFSTILARLNSIQVSEIAKPGNPARETDKILGRLSPFLQRMHQLRIDMNAEAKRGGIELQGVTHQLKQILPSDYTSDFDVLRDLVNNAEFEHLMKRASELKATFEPMARATKLVDEIFWHDIRATFPDAERKKHIYLNSNWDVCWSDSDNKSDEGEGLAGMLAAALASRRKGN